MTIQFKNPPLLELIAELRWQVPFGDFPVMQPGLPFQVQVGPVADDPAVERLRKLCEGMGFVYVERLVPMGAGVMPGQAVYRFRRPDDEVVVQAGPGVLTVHALPPYSSWSAFSPEVKKVVEALLSTRDAGQAQFFDTVSVRYLDAFGARFLGTESPSHFAQHVLGYDIVVPPAVETVRAKNGTTSLSFSYGFATEDGLQGQIALSEAIVNNENSLMLDTNVRASAPVRPYGEALMDVFDRAHDVIHSIFIDATKSVQHIMEPVGGPDV